MDFEILACSHEGNFTHLLSAVDKKKHLANDCSRYSVNILFGIVLKSCRTVDQIKNHIN